MVSVRCSATSSIQPTISTSPVDSSWITAATRPAGSRLSRAAICGSRRSAAGRRSSRSPAHCSRRGAPMRQDFRAPAGGRGGQARRRRALLCSLVTFAKSERADLCDLFDAVGPDAPTLCRGLVGPRPGRPPVDPGDRSGRGQRHRRSSRCPGCTSAGWPRSSSAGPSPNWWTGSARVRRGSRCSRSRGWTRAPTPPSSSSITRTSGAPATSRRPHATSARRSRSGCGAG